MTTETTTTTTEQQPHEHTWTFFGHWEGSTLVINHAVEGEVEDVYPDDGTFPEGLWCAAARGETLEAAEAAARAQYEDDIDAYNDNDGAA